MAVHIVKEFTFDAAHRLFDYEGQCARLHGHTYRVQVGIEPNAHDVFNQKLPIVMDFSALKQIVAPVIKQLDHSFLNDSMQEVNPTAELIASYIFNYVSHNLPAFTRIRFVRVWETPTSYAEVTPGE